MPVSASVVCKAISARSPPPALLTFSSKVCSWSYESFGERARAVGVVVFLAAADVVGSVKYVDCFWSSSGFALTTWFIIAPSVRASANLSMSSNIPADDEDEAAFDVSSSSAAADDDEDRTARRVETTAADCVLRDNLLLLLLLLLLVTEDTSRKQPARAEFSPRARASTERRDMDFYLPQKQSAKWWGDGRT